MPPKKTKIIKPEVTIKEEKVKETTAVTNDDVEGETYYANIFEVTSLVIAIVEKYYSGNKGNYPDFDSVNNKEEYEKIGIYNIYDMARYIIRNRLCDDLVLITQDGKKVNFTNIKFPPF